MPVVETKLDDALPGIHRDQITLREGQVRARLGMMPIEHWFGEFKDEDLGPDPLPDTAEAFRAQEAALEDAGAREDETKETQQSVVIPTEVPAVHEILTEELLEVEPPPIPGGEDHFAKFRGENREEHRKIMALLAELQLRLRNVENHVESEGLRAKVETLVGRTENLGLKPEKTESFVPKPEARGLAATPMSRRAGWLVGKKAVAALMLCAAAVLLVVVVTRNSGQEEEGFDIAVRSGLKGMARYVGSESSELRAMAELPRALGQYIEILQKQRNQAGTDAQKAEIDARLSSQRLALAEAEPKARDAMEGLSVLAKVSGLSTPEAAVEVPSIRPVGN